MAEQLSAQEVQRFARHIILPQVGMEGQVRLKQAKVAVVGAGGLGSPVILYLTAAGVGQLTIIDDDVVDLSNLQRQVLHDSEWVGRAKVESAAARIKALNPAIDVVQVNARLTVDNALEVLRDHDVVVDGSDNFATRYLVNDACEILEIPWVYGSIHRFEGQVSVFNLDGGPNYRDIYPQPPPAGMVPSCSEAGVLGVLPGVIGSIQANEVLKLLLGIGKPLDGILLLYDALEMRFRGIALKRDPSRVKVIELDNAALYCVEGQVQDEGTSDVDTMVNSIDAVTAKGRLDDGWKPYVLDVRSVGEASIASLPFVDALIPHADILDHLDSIPKDRDILVHCHSGVRSMMAAAILGASGWEPSVIYNLTGGIDRWSLDIDASIPRY